MGYWLISLVIGCCARGCALVAGDKGYSPVLFGILGFFFFLITLIVVLVLPRKTRPDARHPDRRR